MPQAVGRSRGLRVACPRLFCDVLAVLCGLRPGFLLDYGQLAPGELAAAAAQLAASLGLPAAGLAVAVLNDCCYLVRPQLLPSLVGCAAPAGSAAAATSAAGPAGRSAIDAAAGAAASGPPVMFVAFQQQQAQWAAAAEAEHAAAQLQALLDGLLAAAAGGGSSTPQHGEQRMAGGRGSSGGTPAAIPVVEAEGIPGWSGLVAPTASGLLLGYPALYLCHSLEGAQAAARCLSSTSLCLHSVACQLQAGPGVPAPDPSQPLLAFSVPAELAAAAEWAACRDTWWAQLRRRHRTAVEQHDLPWTEPQLALAVQAPRPVAL